MRNDFDMEVAGDVRLDGRPAGPALTSPPAVGALAGGLATLAVLVFGVGPVLLVGLGALVGGVAGFAWRALRVGEMDVSGAWEVLLKRGRDVH